MVISHYAKILVIFVLLAASAGNVMAEGSITETFNSSSQIDLGATTANLDLVAGELSLVPYSRSLVANLTVTPAQRITVSGGFAYVGAGASGLYIIDISDPTAPGTPVLASVGGYVRGVDVQGDRAYVAIGLNGIRIVDVSNPASPVVLGAFNTTGYSWDVAVSGDRAYVADSAGGLQVFDVTGTTPVWVCSSPTLSSSYSVEVAGNYVYLADSTAGLRVFDVSNPASPTPVGQYNTPGSSRGLALAGDVAYIADGNNGVRIVDISDPTSPQFLSSYSTPTSAESISVSGDQAYVACGTTGVVILDVIDPAAPSLIETAKHSQDVEDVKVVGRYAYIADSVNGLIIVEYSEATELSLVSDLYHGWVATDMVVDGNLAVVAGRNNGILKFIDISDPAAPVTLNDFSSSADISEIALDGNILYTATSFGMLVIDVSDPLAPFEMGSFDVFYPCESIQISGDVALLGTAAGRIYSVDISDPMNLVNLGSLSGTTSAEAISFQGNRAYVLEEDGILRVLDSSNPASLSQLASLDIGSDGEDLTVVGDYAFAVLKFSGLKIYDVSNPPSISYVGGYGTSAWEYSVAVEGQFAFLGASSQGMHMLDISDLSSPTLVGKYDEVVDMYFPIVAGEHVYATGYTTFSVLQAFQSEESTQGDLAQSTLRVINEDAIALRVVPTETGNVSWSVALGNNQNWEAVQSGQWLDFDSAYPYVRWQATLGWSPLAPPVVSDVTVEWLNEHANITAVQDIAGDQGGQVRLEWLRSGRDFVGNIQQISEYAVYRKVDAAFKSSRVAGQLAGQSFAVQEHAKNAASSGWDFVTSVPVRVQDEYSVVVPTLADSSIAGGVHFTTFMISAMTQSLGVFFDSPPDSGYSVDNIAPGVPVALVATYLANGVSLDWADATEDDFQFHRIYRSTDPGFIPGPSNLVQGTANSSWTDSISNPWGYYYKVTTLDHAGNESDAAEMQTVSGVGDDVAPVRTALLAAYPNPFNPSTRLSFELAAPAHARINIFDTAGRLVKTLVNEQRGAGHHEVVWNGQNTAGQSVASGVYLYRFESGDVVQTKRMMLVK
jgi:hypothetical protein